MESLSLFDPDDHDWYSIRIYVPDLSDQSIEEQFVEFCEDLSIDRYLLCFEEQAAKPHYHSMVECSLEKKKKICNKNNNKFKKHFPSVYGNKSFAWTACYGPKRMFQYICKEGNYRSRSIHFTDQVLDNFKTEYWKEQAEASQKVSLKKQTMKKDERTNQEKFIDEVRKKCKEFTHRSQFDTLFRDFCIEKNISPNSSVMIDKYFGLFLKTMDPIEYQQFVLANIKKRTEQYVY